MTDGDYYFDENGALRVVNFVERALTHVKGEWAGQPFILQPFQKDIAVPLFGWKRTADNTRRFRQAFIAIPRKNAKTTLTAALVLYLLFADGEYGAEIYSAAADREQARLLFGIAKSMIEASPVLAPIARVYKNEIVYPKTDSVYRAISAEAKTKNGYNAHAVVLDEAAQQPNRELYDVLQTSMGARRQPLFISLTTAGRGETNFCRGLWRYAEGVQRGAIVDDTFFPYVVSADPADDWTSPEVWQKANPGYGVTIKEEYLLEQCERAKQMPAYQDTFKQLHLNMWMSQESRWMPMPEWDACNTEVPDLTGRVCYAGLDLASVSDLTAFVLVFPPSYEGEPVYVLPTFWIPEANIEGRERKDRVPYSAWARDGYIETTAGNVIDYDAVFEKIVELKGQYKIVDVAFDRYGATQIATKLADAGIQMVMHGQGYVSMSAPTKEVMRLVLSGKLAHGGHPVLRWNAENVVVEQDAAGNIKPSKGKSREKIDGMVALAMAVGRMERHAEAEKVSVYETRGPLIF